MEKSRFSGTYVPNLLDGKRIALPRRIREVAKGNVLVLTIGFDNCIFGFAKDEWEPTTQAELNRPLYSDKEGRDLRRKIYANAAYVKLDAQGRFVLPSDMMTYAKIRDQLVVIGAGDHFEIWSKQLWEKYRQGI